MTLLLFSKDVETHHFKNKSKSNPALDTHNLTWLFMHVLKKKKTNEEWLRVVIVTS